MAKSLFVMNNPRLKSHINDYISDSRNMSNKAMKFLYNLQDDNMLFQQISMLTFQANLKGINDVYDIMDNQLSSAIEPKSVATAMGTYVYFTLLVNKNYSSFASS